MDIRGGQDVGGEPDGESLPELLRSWRRRSDPRSFPELPVRSRRTVGLTHADVARLTGVSARWYGELERGKAANYSADLLDRLSLAFGLSRAERRALYLRAVGRLPAPAAASEMDVGAEMDEVLQRFLDNQAPAP